MYKKHIFKLLSTIDHSDCIKSKKHILRTVKSGSGESRVLFARIEKKYYFSASGGPYLIAMSKWVQQMLNNGYLQQLAKCDMTKIIGVFSLPDNRHQDALVILNLIERILSDL